jgi:signal transduction histidine kinase
LLLFIFYSHRAAAKLEIEHEKLVDSNERLEQSYKELKVANAKAEESSRMKTNFIQQISHEIRTPLNVLSGFTQVITTPDVTLDNDTKADVSMRITENTRRITELVNKMLAMSDANSRTVIERSDYVPAIQIAAQAADTSRISQNDDIVFDMQIAPEVENIQLRTNLQQAIQALVMLLDNAQKFLHEKHPLAKLAKRGTVRLFVQKNSQMIEYVVEDTGIGIAKEEAEHIFDEFVQLNEFYDGTGIGLPVARSIARRMGGEVILDTSYNSGGSRFIFSLPMDA